MVQSQMSVISQSHLRGHMDLWHSVGYAVGLDQAFLTGMKFPGQRNDYEWPVKHHVTPSDNTTWRKATEYVFSRNLQLLEPMWMDAGEYGGLDRTVGLVCYCKQIILILPLGQENMAPLLSTTKITSLVFRRLPCASWTSWRIITVSKCGWGPKRYPLAELERTTSNSDHRRTQYHYTWRIWTTGTYCTVASGLNQVVTIDTTFDWCNSEWNSIVR